MALRVGCVCFEVTVTEGVEKGKRNRLDITESRDPRGHT